MSDFCTNSTLLWSERVSVFHHIKKKKTFVCIIKQAPTNLKLVCCIRSSNGTFGLFVLYEIRGNISDLMWVLSE